MRNRSVFPEMLTSQNNRDLLILETIKRKGEVSLGTISQETELNVPTISNHLNDLIKKKIVLEKGEVFTGGRPATLIELNSQAAHILGIGINLKSVTAVVIDFKGKVLAKAKERIKDGDIREILKSAMNKGKAVIKKAGLNKKDINVVGIGIAGIVDYENGLIHWPSKIGPRYVSVYLSIEEVISKEFNFSNVLVENDATAAAFAEWWLYLPKIKDAIYIYAGVGCGLIINGELYRGATGSAGEISIYNPQMKDFDSLAAENHPFCRWNLNLGVVKRAKEKIKKGEKSQIFKLARNNVENIDINVIIQAAEGGDELGLELIKKVGTSLGVRLAYLINLLDPEIVIVGGGMERAGNCLLAFIKETIRKWSFNHSLKRVKIVPARIGEEVVAIGAANLAIRRMFMTM